MLLVFLMAAIIAIALYREMPRIAFEAQRTKEQLLQERGKQYTRAIQLFVRKVNRYPATIEELENLNNTRFLRKRYIDPMTGKDKWRLIHVNGGVLTDSIIPPKKQCPPGQACPDQQQQPANTNTFIGEGPVMGASTDPSQQQINPAMRRRASDDRPVVTQEAPQAPAAEAGDDNSASDNSDNSDNNNENNENNENNDQTPAPGTPGAANTIPGQQPPGVPGRVPQPGMYQPGTYPGQPGFNPATANQQFGTPGSIPNQPSNPGGMGGMSSNNGQSGDQSSGSSVYAAPGLGSQPAPVSSSPTGMPMPGQQPGFPGQPGGFPGQPGFPGRPGMFPGQPGGFPGQAQGGFGQPAQPTGFGAGGGSAFGSGGGTGFGSGGGTGFGSGAATAGQNNMFGLTSASNMQPPGGGLPGMGGTQVGGGIAGVASEAKGPSIMIYNERKKYNEWEFVYDQSKDRGLAGVQKNGGAPGTPAGQMGSMPGQQPGQQSGGQSSGFGGGQSSSFGGQSSSFGSQSSGFGSSTPQQPQQPQQPQN